MKLRHSASMLVSGGQWFASAGRWLYEYFQHHGVWAPAVRLLRILSMRRKAWLLFAVFLLPVTVLTALELYRVVQDYREVELKRNGLHFSSVVQQLVPALYRIGSPDADVKSAVQTLHAEMLASYANMPDVHAGTQTLMGAYERRHNDTLALLSREGVLPGVLAQALSDEAAALSAWRMEVSRMAGLWQESDQSVAAMVELSQDTLSAITRHVVKARTLGAELVGLSTQQPPPVDKILEAQIALAKEVGGAQIALARTSFLLYGQPALGLTAEGEKSVALSKRWLGDVEQSLLSREVLADATALNTQADEALLAVRGLRKTVTQLLSQVFEQRQQQVQHRQVVWMVVLACLLGVTVYFLLAFLQVMSGGINMLHGEMERLAKGDLSSRPEARGRDEIATLTTSLGLSLMRLSDLLASMRQGVASVTHASTEIAHGNASLSQRTDRTAASIEDILQRVTRYASELDECSLRVTEAMRAVEALQIDAVRSRKHMNKLQQCMQALLGKSREISEIVGLIDGIAYRTNILALNASVEAAKAGESGRGFAVVAQEVRSLALRSADSAKRINDIVVRSTDDIEQGNALTDLAVQSLDGSTVHVKNIHTAMDRIVSLTRSGQSSAEHIVGELKTLNDSTGENRSLVSQLAQAADALRRQGERLTRKVDNFRLK